MRRSTGRNAHNGIPEDDERNRPERAVSSEKGDEDSCEDDIAHGSATQEDQWSITLVAPDIRTIREEEALLFLSILPPSVTALIDVTDGYRFDGEVPFADGGTNQE